MSAAASAGNVDELGTEPSTDERVRQASLELFAERGFHGVGIREIALAARISISSLYHYMGTKSDLVFRIMAESQRSLIDAATQVTAGLEAPVDRLVALTYLHVLSHALRSRETLVADNELRALEGEHHDTIVALRDDYEQIWADAIQAGIDSGVFNVPDASLARLAVLQMCSGVARWFKPSGAQPAQAVAERYVEMALALLGYRGPQPSTVHYGDYRRTAREIWHIAA